MRQVIKYIKISLKEKTSKILYKHKLVSLAPVCAVEKKISLPDWNELLF